MKSKKFYGTCVRCGEAIETGYPMEFGNAIDPEGGPRHIHCPAVPPRIRKEANRKGYRLQLDQHLPEGYIGALMLSVFGPHGRAEYGPWRTSSEARPAIKEIVERL